MSAQSQLEIARRQIEFAREYTRSLIADVEDQRWFTIPAGCVTHVAWQVGHLAMAQYGLCLFRIRGRRSEDAELMSSAFRKKYFKGTTPDPDPARNPEVGEIREVFDRVHNQAIAEMAHFEEADLQEPIDEPYAVYNTKLGGLLFCSHHEMMHAGQIGLLRRLLGKAPVR